jgi:serine/threonine protein kinase/Flp pilus assembly protein TadD
MSAAQTKMKSIFAQAMALSPSGERAEYLQQACAGDPTLQAEIESLLRADRDAGSFLRERNRCPAFADDEPVTECPGGVIGPYKLLEQIGAGGFGVVFMAEQTQPVRRKVALKVIKPGMDTRQVIARFEAERQALALMDHANIAKVLGAGETATGRPYFVMDLVEGLPITEYCDQNRLTPQERLELFLPVCEAVQHAHQKGVIHRDLKPSNVVVSQQEGTPAAKVIDFGIAKAIRQQLTDKTLLTGSAQILGTPLHMSPEQAAGGSDIDTRSDIYSLGVLLYELLTARTPLEEERFSKVGYDELRRIIREEEPPKPSTRISTLGPAAATVSTNRKSDPTQLSRLFRGEIDWIVMKALAKDRNHRYESASALAADVRRYLNDEPVHAYPPSAHERVRRFARRNKTGLATAGLMATFLVLLVGSVGWTIRDRAARKEEAERDRAARVAAMEEKASLALKEAETLAQRTKWFEALEAAKLAEGFLAEGTREDLAARVRQAKKDLEMVLRLEEIWMPSGRDFVPWQADAPYTLAFRDYGIDIDSLEPAEAARRIRARPIKRELLAALDTWSQSRRGNSEDRQADWKRLLAVARAADDDSWRNQVRDALEQDDHRALNKLATSAQVSDLPAQTLSLLVYRASLDGEQLCSLLRQVQRERPDDFTIDFQLAWIFQHEPGIKNLNEAIRFYTAAVAARPRNAGAHFYLGIALEDSGRFGEGIAEYLKAAEVTVDNPLIYNHAAWRLATCQEPKLRNASRAVELARKAVELSPRDSLIWNTLGVAEYRVGNWKAATEALKKAQELEPARYFAWNAFFLSMAHWQLGQKEQARKEYKQAAEWMETKESNNEELHRFRCEAEQLLKQQKN